MEPKDLDDIILAEAEAIKKRRSDIAQSVEELRRKKMSVSDRFFAVWNNKVIPAFWIFLVLWFVLSIFGAIPKI